jgi:hypothetical protein
MSKWFSANKLSLNLDKTIVIKFITNSPQCPLNIGCNDIYIEGAIKIKFLGLQSDNHLNWEKPYLSVGSKAKRSMLCS